MNEWKLEEIWQNYNSVINLNTGYTFHLLHVFPWENITAAVTCLPDFCIWFVSSYSIKQKAPNIQCFTYHTVNTATVLQEPSTTK